MASDSDTSLLPQISSELHQPSITTGEVCSSSTQEHQHTTTSCSSNPFQHTLPSYTFNAQFPNSFQSRDHHQSTSCSLPLIGADSAFYLIFYLLQLSHPSRAQSYTLLLFEHSSDRQSCRQTAVAASLSSPPSDNHQASLDKQTPISSETPTKSRPVLPKRTRVQIPHVIRAALQNNRYRDTMDGYQGYREPPLARSPPERTSWGGRDENYRDRPSDRPESRDKFYRGRSPGTFIHNCESHFCTGLYARVLQWLR
jgi:hypothetical protein